MSSCTESPHPFPLRTLPFLVTQSFLVTRTTRLPLSRLLRSCLKCGATVQAGASHCFKANTDRYLTEGRLVQGSSSSLKTKTQANHPSDCDRPTIRVAAPGGKECVFLHQIPWAHRANPGRHHSVDRAEYAWGGFFCWWKLKMEGKGCRRYSEAPK